MLDHVSRAVIGFALFKKQPTATDIRDFVRRATRRAGAAPKHVVTDRGKQFTSKTFRRWCRKRGVRQRFGAVGQKGSIAVIERFFRTLKSEGTRRVYGSTDFIGTLERRKPPSDHVLRRVGYPGATRIPGTARS